MNGFAVVVAMVYAGRVAAELGGVVWDVAGWVRGRRQLRAAEAAMLDGYLLPVGPSGRDAAPARRAGRLAGVPGAANGAGWVAGSQGLSGPYRRATGREAA